MKFRPFSEFFFIILSAYRIFEFSFAIQTEFATDFHIRKDYFTKYKRVSSDYDHTVIWAIQQRNADKLEAVLMDVSDQSSENYGKYLTSREVAELTANALGTAKVLKYLDSFGVLVTHQTLYGEYITARASVGTWELIFGNKFYFFHHSENSHEPVPRALHYKIHENISDHVNSVIYVVQLPLPQPSISPQVTEIKQTSLGYVTPSLLNSYYNIFSNNGSMSIKQNIYSALGQYFSSTDLASFQTLFNIKSHPVDYDPDSRNNHAQCVSNVNNCAESNLDLQWIMAVAQNTYTSITYNSYNDVFWTWITTTASSPNPASVQSISYGYNEYDIQSYTSYLENFNLQAIKLGTMGVTIVVASGDDGAPGRNARSNSANCRYDTSYPASSPYVVAVGATQGPESGITERVCQYDNGYKITSGGGFSLTQPALSHQISAINSYFSSVSTQPVSGYNRSGRALPDVSLMGYGYATYIGAGTYLSSGTSASTPAFAGMISLINAARARLGQSTVGYINKVLYTSGGSFANDITSGNTKCTASSVCCTQGFYASTGWDPTTGFGSVDFTKLYNLFVSSNPTSTPTSRPSSPTSTPTAKPSSAPSDAPTSSPSASPSVKPSASPTFIPTVTPSSPTVTPSITPSSAPSTAPSIAPSNFPTTKPSSAPSNLPSITPSVTPINPLPSEYPTMVPSSLPSVSPSLLPTSIPSRIPSAFPTEVPTTSSPTSLSPTRVPKQQTPSHFPSLQPVVAQSEKPSLRPSMTPTTITSPASDASSVTISESAVLLLPIFISFGLMLTFDFILFYK